MSSEETNHLRLLDDDGKHCLTYWAWRPEVLTSRDSAGPLRFKTAEDRSTYREEARIFRGSTVVGFGYVIYDVREWEETVGSSTV